MIVAVLALVLVWQFAFPTGILPARAALLDDQEGIKPGGEIGTVFGTAGEPTSIQAVVANVIRVFLGLLGIIFVVLIVLAGYKWMTAMGDSGKVDEAREQLSTAVIGLAIILAAYGITIFVMSRALKATNTPTTVPELQTSVF